MALAVSEVPTFSTLPGELRNEIYRLILFTPRILSISCEGRASEGSRPAQDGGLWKTSDQHGRFNIFLTCKAIYEEAYAVYCDVNRFGLHIELTCQQCASRDMPEEVSDYEDTEDGDEDDETEDEDGFDASAISYTHAGTTLAEPASPGAIISTAPDSTCSDKTCLRSSNALLRPSMIGLRRLALTVGINPFASTMDMVDDVNLLAERLHDLTALRDLHLAILPTSEFSNLMFTILDHLGSTYEFCLRKPPNFQMFELTEAAYVAFLTGQPFRLPPSVANLHALISKTQNDMIVIQPADPCSVQPIEAPLTIWRYPYTIGYAHPLAILRTLTETADDGTKRGPTLGQLQHPNLYVRSYIDWRGRNAWHIYGACRRQVRNAVRELTKQMEVIKADRQLEVTWPIEEETKKRFWSKEEIDSEINVETILRLKDLGRG